MAKVVVSSQGPTLESMVDPRFGRAAYFLVVDTDTMEFEVLDNSKARAAAHGAGIQAAQMVASAKPEAVITGVVGPKAFEALRAAGLKVFQEATGSVREAVEAYLAGKLKPTNAPLGGGGGMGGGMGMGGGRGMGRGRGW